VLEVRVGAAGAVLQVPRVLDVRVLDVRVLDVLVLDVRVLQELALDVLRTTGTLSTPSTAPSAPTRTCSTSGTYFASSLMRAGTTSNRSPAMP
jgi:hypothetical protein